MSKHEISDIAINKSIVTFTVHLKGAVKDQSVRPNWIVSDIDLIIRDNSVGLRTLLEGYISSSHYWIKIQGWLRRCSHEFVKSLVGTTMSWLAFKATVAAALPRGMDKAEMLKELLTKDKYIDRLRAQLKALGLTDQQIDEATL